MLFEETVPGEMRALHAYVRIGAGTSQSHPCDRSLEQVST